MSFAHLIVLIIVIIPVQLFGAVMTASSVSRVHPVHSMQQVARGPGAEPLVRFRGAKPPKLNAYLYFECPEEAANLLHC